MSTVIDELLRDVYAAGIHIQSDPPDLIVTPAHRLTPELEERLRHHKADILRRFEFEASKRRLESHKICIAVDCVTGSALLLFKASDADIIRDVSEVYQPFQIGKLTPAQCKELLESLDYYDSLLKRKVHQ